MKELNLSEIACVSGAGGEYANNGYTFTFIVGNAVFMGVAVAILGGNPVYGAIVGGGYATTMMVANLADSYFFQVPIEE